MSLQLQFKVSLGLHNFEIAARRLLSVDLSSQAIPSSLMSPDAQAVLVETVAQVLSVVFAQIDILSISAASVSLTTLKDVLIVFTTSYYAVPNTNMTSANILSSIRDPKFLSLLKSNAAANSTSVANAYLSVNVSSIAVEQTYPVTSSQVDSTTLVIAIVVSIGGFLSIFGLCSFLYLQYLSTSYSWRHMIPLNELIHEDADLGASRRV